jgi:hypothetical protein
MTESTSDSCCNKKSKCRCCGLVFAILHIAILTCISMALWKAAWAIEAVADKLPAAG